MKTHIISALLGLGVALSLVCCWGMLRMKDAYQQMHFMSPPASLAAIFITIAIFLQNGRKPESFKAVFIVLVLLAMNTFVTHATARCFRLRERVHWDPLPGQEVPIDAEDEIIVPGENGKAVR
jgi:monovalent cation/proton antiporter MnhG/PhaG subunit